MKRSLRLATVFQDNGVLQREKPVAVWGWGQPGRSVTVSIQEKTETTCVGNDGKWSLSFPALSTSACEVLTVADGNETIILKNLAVGEVWLLGGQSNMEFWMRYEKHITEERPQCANPNIRFYDVPEIAFKGQEQLFDYSEMGKWRVCMPEEIDWFSAVGYYFAKALQAALNVPIGLIGCNWGGTTAQAWMNPASVTEAAKPWMEDHIRSIAQLDRDEYWRGQQTNPENNTGRPFENEFNNRFLPVTVMLEEAMQFFTAQFGDSKGNVDFSLRTKPASTFPGCLYEHMLKTVAPYTLRGVLWYQGESDEPHADIYGIVLTRMIGDWRALWNESVPFLMVQLPGYESWLGGVQTRYNELRQAQKAVAAAVENVWMTSISDAGEQYDIHPKDKKTPGERLALLARGGIYHENIQFLPPEAYQAEKIGNSIRISFRNAEGGLHTNGTELNAMEVFTLSGGKLDYRWHTEGDSLILELPQMPKEKIQLRFATQLFYLVNLYNAAGIPAVPFALEV